MAPYMRKWTGAVNATQLKASPASANTAHIMTDRLIIALAQLNPTLGAINANLAKAREARVTAKDADLVLFPELFPAVLTGFTLAFARALGEYGSVIFIAGNMPMKSEITPLLIMVQLEQYDYAGATAIALVFLLASFSVLLLANLLSRRRRKQVPA